MKRNHDMTDKCPTLTDSPPSPFAITDVTAVDLQKAPHGISTGIGFFDHMLDQFNSHAQIGVSATVTKRENDGIVNGDIDASTSNNCSVAGKEGINRYANPSELQEQLMGQVGSAFGVEFHKLLSSLPVGRQSRFCCPLDEALVECNITLTDAEEGCLEEFTLEPYGIYPKLTGRTKIGCMVTAYVKTFFSEFAKTAKLNVTLRKIRGHNGHHVVESGFKAFSRAIRNIIDGTNTSTPSASPTSTPTASPINGNAAHAMAMEQMWGVTSESYTQSMALQRSGVSKRETKETSINVDLQLDGSSSGISIDTGIETLNEFYRALAEEANLSLNIKCHGDTWVDDHHTAEDVSIAIGKVLNIALGTKAGLNRMWCGNAKIGDAHVEVTMDLSNRPCFNHGLSLDGVEYIGDLSMEMLQHILESLVMNGQMTVHIDERSKGNAMDLVIATAKSFGKALKFCSAVDPRRAGKIASSKGTLSA